MSGVIRVAANEGWGAATWVFDGVLERVRVHLPPQNADLHEAIAIALDSGVRRLNLQKCSDADVDEFFKAAKKALERTLEDGSQSFAEPKFFAGFVKLFESLLQMLDARLRAGSPQGHETERTAVVIALRSYLKAMCAWENWLEDHYESVLSGARSRESFDSAAWTMYRDLFSNHCASAATPREHLDWSIPSEHDPEANEIEVLGFCGSCACDVRLSSTRLDLVHQYRLVKDNGGWRILSRVLVLHDALMDVSL